MADHEGKIEETSPYYLCSGDQPGNLISHILLQNDNYFGWSKAVTIALKGRRKFSFLDDTINKPVENHKLLNWENVNSMLVSWILRSMEPRLAQTVPYFEEAKTLWDYLAKRFFIANGPCLQQLRADITRCR
ncbi:hypothetical protein LIER_42937 [Lithospermum erythrorhizon]|uniref:Retrotransposon Copia-like N-terminal domain-containing protein n=1 Tax=Lithospermum erythrorhizon TaxID=34254 RepID=A0AAV3P642_LITER